MILNYSDTTEKNQIQQRSQQKERRKPCNLKKLDRIRTIKAVKTRQLLFLLQNGS